MENKKHQDPLFGFVNEPWTDDQGEIQAIPFNLYKSHLKEIMDKYCTDTQDPSKSQAKFTLFKSRKGDWMLRVWDPYSEKAIEGRRNKQRAEGKQEAKAAPQEDDDMPF